jgi:hypothetical protein
MNCWLANLHNAQEAKVIDTSSVGYSGHKNTNRSNTAASRKAIWPKKKLKNLKIQLSSEE